MVTELGEKTVPPCPTVTVVVAAKAAPGSNNKKRRASRKFMRKIVEPEPIWRGGYQKPGCRVPFFLTGDNRGTEP
jgi:hypothetical protein